MAGKRPAFRGFEAGPAWKGDGMPTGGLAGRRRIEANDDTQKESQNDKVQEDHRYRSGRLHGAVFPDDDRRRGGGSCAGFG